MKKAREGMLEGHKMKEGKRDQKEVRNFATDSHCRKVFSLLKGSRRLLM